MGPWGNKRVQEGHKFNKGNKGEQGEHGGTRGNKGNNGNKGEQGGKCSRSLAASLGPGSALGKKQKP